MPIPPGSTHTLGPLFPDPRPSPRAIYLLMWKRAACSAPSSGSVLSCRIWPRSNEPRPDHAPSDSECRAVWSPIGSFPGSFFDLLAGHFTSFFASIMPGLLEAIIHLLGLSWVYGPECGVLRNRYRGLLSVPSAYHRVSDSRSHTAAFLLSGLTWALGPDCHRLGSKCGETRCRVVSRVRVEDGGSMWVLD